MKIAFYKAKHGTLLDRLIDRCSGGDGYSHVELVFSDGMFFSSSAEDGGVRLKRIVPVPQHWDLFELLVSPMREGFIRDWAEKQAGKKYDWGGVLSFEFPMFTHMRHRQFCSAECFRALEYGKLVRPSRPIHPWKVNPDVLYLMLAAAGILNP